MTVRWRSSNLFCLAAALVSFSQATAGWSAGNHLGWCQGVGNPHKSSDCRGAGISGASTGTSNLPVQSSNQLPGQQSLPPTVSGGYAVPPLPPSLVPYPVPNPTPTPIPYKIPQLVPQPYPVPVLAPTLAPYLVPKPTPNAVPNKIPQLVPQPYPVPVLAPALAPYPVPNPTPNAVPGRVPQLAPQLIARPVPLKKPVTGFQASLVQTGQRPPAGAGTSANASHSTTHLEPPRSNTHVSDKPGRQAPHDLPQHLDVSTGDIWDCAVSGHGRRRTAAGGRGTTLAGVFADIDVVDAIAKDVPARHPRDAGCLVSIKRKHRN